MALPPKKKSSMPSLDLPPLDRRNVRDTRSKIVHTTTPGTTPSRFPIRPAASMKQITRKEFNNGGSAWEILKNPITALKYKLKGQDIPANFEKGPRVSLDYAADILNPVQWVGAAGRTIKNTFNGNIIGNVGKNIANIATQMDNGVVAYPGAAADLLSNAGDALVTVGGAPAAKQIARLAAPAKLVNRIDTSPLPNLTMGAINNGKFSDAAALVGIAGAAEIAPIVSKIPGLKKIYKDTAYEMASRTGGGSSLEPHDVVKALLKKGSRKNKTYNGDNAMFDESMRDVETLMNKRNLLKQYIYGGDQPGFKRSKEIPEGLEAYEKRYGKMDVFEMNSKTGNGNEIEFLDPYVKQDFDKALKTVGVVDPRLVTGKSQRFGLESGNPINPTDDIAGHLGWIDNTKGGTPELVSQDIWKFTPEDYTAKWSRGTRGKDMTAKEYMTGKQAKLMDHAGKPFITMSRNPLGPVNINKPINKGMPFDQNWNKIQDALDKLTPEVVASFKQANQFKNGGMVKKSEDPKKPKKSVLTAPALGGNEPTRADSLFLLNNNKIIRKTMGTGRYEWKDKQNIDKATWPKKYAQQVKVLPQNIKIDITEGHKKGKPSEYVDKRGNMVGTQDWRPLGGEDKFLPKQYIHPTIAPQYQGDMVPRFLSDLDPDYKKLQISDPKRYKLPLVYSYGYDDLAITPWDMLSPSDQKKRLAKYGTDGTGAIGQKPQAEPTLKGTRGQTMPLAGSSNQANMNITAPQRTGVDVGAIADLPYRVEYHDGKSMTHQDFPDEKTGTQFQNDLRKRDMGIPFGTTGSYKPKVAKLEGGGAIRPAPAYKTMAFDPIPKLPEDPNKVGAAAIGGAASFIGDMGMNVMSAYDNARNSQIQPGQTTLTNQQSTGGAAFSGMAKGASAGAALGPIGAGVGAAVGLVGGLLTGGAMRKGEEREQKQLDSVARDKYQKLDLMSNLDPYGSAGVFYAEEGGMPPAQEGQQAEGPQMQMVDVEKGEILIDPVTLEVLREYKNPNRFKSHAKNPQFEPIGNFTQIEEGKVVISKKYAARYLAGDTLTKKSIVLEILKNQRNQPTPMISTNVPQAADGLKVPRPLPWGQKNLNTFGFQSWINKQQGKNVLVEDGVYGKNTKKYYTPENKAAWEAEMGNDPGVAAPELIGAPDAPATLNSGIFPGGIQEMPLDPYARKTYDNPVTDDQDAGGKNKIFSPTNVARALNFVPTGFGLADALRYEPEAYDENTQFDSAKSYLQGMETNPSIEASRGAINTAQANRNRMLNNINSPSVRAEMAAGNADVIKAEGDLIQNATNFALDARNKKRGTLAELESQQGQQRYSSRQALTLALKQNRAARQAMAQKGLSEGVTNFGAQVMDDNKLRALNSMLEFYKVGNDGGMNDTGAFTDIALEMFNSGKDFTRSDLDLKYKEEVQRRDANGRLKGSTSKQRLAPKTT